MRKWLDALKEAQNTSVRRVEAAEVVDETATATLAIPAEFINQDLDFGEGMSYVRDDRGVRLAREQEEED